MQLTSTILLLSASLASAHYTFPALILNGQATGDWQYVKKAATLTAVDPLKTSTPTPCDATMIQKPPKQQLPMLRLAIWSDSLSQVASHTQVLSFSTWLESLTIRPPPILTEKVPSGSKSTRTSLQTPRMVFDITEVYVKIPRCLPDGEYLLRVEHIALHNAYQTGGAQFFLGCAQLNVTGGWVGATPSTPPTLVSFPGAYNATDPGIKLNIWAPDAISYVNPGPPVYHCLL
ncbi:hypothetical protein TWF102_007118 [Orbilia oligospora]|uniref:lytic cellulose monooxygenase (C4-dehydrogenating) n=1 Tax=Orbilia oligospora TaxID=2813651 RepID=A0A7C8NGQ2_ORBOL|nr:hypothetical protein TWF102_007118 [Orbilia oligospora]KAF3140782.1 hypothetical protein TWF594_006281 [Orbilia oligospora]